MSGENDFECGLRKIIVRTPRDVGGARLVQVCCAVTICAARWQREAIDDAPFPSERLSVVADTGKSSTRVVHWRTLIRTAHSDCPVCQKVSDGVNALLKTPHRNSRGIRTCTHSWMSAYCRIQPSYMPPFKNAMYHCSKFHIPLFRL